MKVLIVFLFVLVTMSVSELHAKNNENRREPVIDIQETSDRLRNHLKALTLTIGERSVRFPENLKKTAEYIESFLQEIELPVHREPYTYHNLTVNNIVAGISFVSQPKKRFLIGAHYDSVTGTVGADDNASAVAVQLEIARNLKEMSGDGNLDMAVKFVFFALEEPPVYGTRYMGSRVYAAKARKEKELIDGMICLEMVGYACYQKGCQDYPFPLMFLGYPEKGDFIGIVGNFQSRSFAHALAGEFRKNNDLPVVQLTVPFNGWLMPSVRLSDHASFWDKGFRAVMITDSAFYRNHNYHMPSDTMDKLDFRFMAELVESLIIFFCSHRQ